MRDTSRFIPGESIALAKPWDFSAVGSDAILLPLSQGSKNSKDNRDSKESEAARAQSALLVAATDAARAEGFADGFAQGHAKATLEAQHQINEYTRNQGHEAAVRFANLANSLQAEVNAARETMADGVLELACELARAMVQREVVVDPQLLLPIIRAGLDHLKDEAKPVHIRLNPRDMDALKAPLAAEFAQLPFTLVADTHVASGGCQMESAGTQIDATVPARWHRAMATVGQTTPWEDPDRDR
jgi:flagellar assembly protein FliH